ncbi:hypothetical protein JL722_14165 [Aureococcus anophagefferens]|nr:hypothetical protein JL722_14165 [Aureococcus anophagefferens]
MKRDAQGAMPCAFSSTSGRRSIRVVAKPRRSRASRQPWPPSRRSRVLARRHARTLSLKDTSRFAPDNDGQYWPKTNSPEWLALQKRPSSGGPIGPRAPRDGGPIGPRAPRDGGNRSFFGIPADDAPPVRSPVEEGWLEQRRKARIEERAREQAAEARFDKIQATNGAKPRARRARSGRTRLGRRRRRAERMRGFRMTPAEIKRALDLEVVGQHAAKRAIAVAVAEHYGHARRSPTAGDDREAAEFGVVHVDEIDKVCERPGGLLGGGASVNTRDVQTSLLKLMEDGARRREQGPPVSVRAGAKPASATFSTKFVLWIFSGAFVPLLDRLAREGAAGPSALDLVESGLIHESAGARAKAYFETYDIELTVGDDARGHRERAATPARSSNANVSMWS